MTAAPRETEPLRSALVSAGRRLTRQRAQVFDYLRASDHHPTAEQVFEAVRDAIPNISLATVYKALDALVEGGLAVRLPAVDGGPARFDARTEAHYHLRDLRTGEVVDLPTPFVPDLIDRLDPGLVARLAAEGFRVTGYRLELIGDSDSDPPRHGA